MRAGPIHMTRFVEPRLSRRAAREAPGGFWAVFEIHFKHLGYFQLPNAVFINLQSVVIDSHNFDVQYSLVKPPTTWLR